MPFDSSILGLMIFGAAQLCLVAFLLTHRDLVGRRVVRTADPAANASVDR